MDATKHACTVADALKAACAPDEGFAALLLVGDGTATYVSSGNRADVQKVLAEWLERTAFDGAGVVRGDETPEQRTARLTLEDRCAAAGKALGVPLVLFFFTYGEGGHLAYWTNLPAAREVVQHVLAAQKNLS